MESASAKARENKNNEEMMRLSVRARVRLGLLELLRPLVMEDGVRELLFRTDASAGARLFPSVILFEDFEREVSRAAGTVTLEYYLYAKVTVTAHDVMEEMPEPARDMRAFLIARVQQLICVPPADPIFTVVAGGEELSLGLGKFIAAPFVRFRVGYTRACADPFALAGG